MSAQGPAAAGGRPGIVLFEADSPTIAALHLALLASAAEAPPNGPPA